MTEVTEPTAVSGGEAASAEPLTYGSYLKIDELLGLQRLRSEPPHPEELHFIVVHQALELWFKLLLHDLERLIAAIDADGITASLVLLRRINDVMACGLDQMRSLHDMPPASFHEFRSYLGTASGLQSRQFRELELLSGLRDESYLRSLRAHGELDPVLQARLDQRPLTAAVKDAAARRGIVDVEGWADFYSDPGEHGGFYVFAEALVDYDEVWMRWRAEHVTLVERSIGASARGTGGTAISYLRKTQEYRYFADLWDLRSELAARAGGRLVPRRR